MRPRIDAIALGFVIAIWLALGAVTAGFTSRVADWFVMTDELLYERLAISIAQTGSPLPRVHDEAISNINQLYPVVISPFFRSGSIVDALHQSHVLNAFVMSSVALPSFLLARRIARPSLAVVAAVASVVVPWLTLASFLLTEVVAYPMFMWALLAIHVAIARPWWRNDALAVVAIAVAVLARTQFYALAVALPVALLGYGATQGRVRETLRAHRFLIAVYIVGAVAALVLTAAGSNVLGTYGATTSGNPFPASIVGAIAAHVTVVGLATGLLPLLVGGGWLITSLGRHSDRERHAFAWLAVVTFVVLVVEVASFNERFGGGVVRERYLFYVAPVLFCALAAALDDVRLPRWSLLGPGVVFLTGLTQTGLPVFEKLNVDSPAAVVDDWLQSTMHGLSGARVALALSALVVALLFVEAGALLPRGAVAAGASVLLIVALTAETGYAFKRLFAVDGTSGLPLTLDQSSVFSWVDRQITPASNVVVIPYAIVRGDYWASVGFWWDLEFWNASVSREGGRPHEFSGTPPGTFPKLDLRFDPRTGVANVDLDSYVAQAASDVRFHFRSREQTTERDVSLVFPDRPWRADWVTYGLYSDGWTRPNMPARVRIFGSRSTSPERRIITFTLVAPPSATQRTVHFRSNEGAWRVEVTANATPVRAAACVGSKGFADITMTVDGNSEIAVDQSTAESFGRPREGGVLVASLNLASEVERCRRGAG